MKRLDEYRRQLTSLKDWTPYLLSESGLPGPRGNLELAQVVAELADAPQIERLLSDPRARSPENTPGVFLAFCGVAALGRLIARGESKELSRLRDYASDPRWRVREAVAIGLQYVGDEDVRLLIRGLRTWVSGSWYERRAIAAALAEPRLLKVPAVVRQVLQLLDRITREVTTAADRTSAAFRACRQTLGYAWSVAVAAAPEAGVPFMEKWSRSADPDVRWIMRENLGKSRLLKMDPAWVRKWAAVVRS